MKKTTLFAACVFILCCGITISSCKKDELKSRELLVFMKGDKGGGNTNVFTVDLVYNATVSDTTIEVAAYATRELSASAEVTIMPDDASVSTYNTKYAKTHVVLPAANYEILNGSKFQIAAGSSTSSALRLKIKDAAALTNVNGYLLPLKITALQTNDKGVQISGTHATMYVLVVPRYNNIANTEVPLTSPLMARTAWAVTVSGSSTGTANQATNMLDGNNGTWWRSNSSTTAAKTVTLNLGSAQTIKGFRLSPNYNNVLENPTWITVATSTDNVTYTTQGLWKGTIPAAGSSATAPDFKGINLVTPVEARYWRFTISAWGASSVGVVGIAELNAIQ